MGKWLSSLMVVMVAGLIAMLSYDSDAQQRAIVVPDIELECVRERTGPHTFKMVPKARMHFTELVPRCSGAQCPSCPDPIPAGTIRLRIMKTEGGTNELARNQKAPGSICYNFGTLRLTNAGANPPVMQLTLTERIRICE